MNLQTAELSGRALRYAMAISLGEGPNRAMADVLLGKHAYDKEWGLTGPVMDALNVEPYRHGGLPRAAVKFPREIKTTQGKHIQTQAFRAYSAPELLTAICRCVVAYHQGDFVDIPETLLEPA